MRAGLVLGLVVAGVAATAAAFAKPKKRGGMYAVVLQAPAAIVGNDANLKALGASFGWRAEDVATWSISNQPGMNILEVVFLASATTPPMPKNGTTGVTGGVPWKVTSTQKVPVAA